MINRDMVKEFTNDTPLLASRQYQIRVTPEIHTSIWILRKNYLLTVEPLEESIRKGKDETEELRFSSYLVQTTPRIVHIITWN